ncbi:uncharacterized protein CMC5_039450 [Chondromyces crocatus]|uniref:Beta-ketoacyl synthase N-terminal domain-containing protein n=1 Tax=Chondromyces crocatus TaxID=52 RepID=A0A0K1EG20_CHOCO|nr:uncharacterized protein CMC5_039450 [Chondromyces crocatus]
MVPARPRATILGFGAWGPLGVEALQIAMCARAGRIEPRPTRFFDQRGHRISVSRSVALSDDLLGTARIAALGAHALREAAQGLEQRVPGLVHIEGMAPPPSNGAARATGNTPPGLPLIVAVSDRVSEEDDTLLASLGTLSAVKTDPARSTLIRSGHAGFAVALMRALALLEEGVAPAVLVGAIDTYYDEPFLLSLDRADRLNALDCRGGITPSEGAAFLALGWDTFASSALGWVRFVASDQAGPRPEEGEAMASLIELAAASTGPIGWLLSDVNAEPTRTAAWAAAEHRAAGALAAQARSEQWIEELGEVGAATGALLSTIACAYWDVGCAPRSSTLVALHGDGPERAVLVLEEIPRVPAQGVSRPSMTPAAAFAEAAFDGPDSSIPPPRRAPSVAPPPSSSTVQATPPFRASVGVPSLHRFAPASAGEAPDEDVRPQLRRLARDSLEDIAIFGDLWRQREEEPAALTATLEQQVLDNLDALVALVRRRPAPEAVKEINHCALEMSFPDRGRGFALALALGCIDDEEAARAAISAMRKAHPGTLPAWETGLRLASSPEIEAAAARLLRSERTPLVRVALEVLRARRAADMEIIIPLISHSEGRVRAAATRCLASIPDPDTVRPLLEARLTDPDDGVALAAAEGLIVLGVPSGIAWVRERLEHDLTTIGGMSREQRNTAARLVALAGSERDFQLLVDVVAFDTRAAEMLGWYGHPDGVDLLIDLLDQVHLAIASREPVRGSDLLINRALHRITGVTLEPDPVAWRSWYEENHSKLPRARLRFGALYTPSLSLEELSRENTPLRVRRDCALELLFHLGPAGRIEVDGWSMLLLEAISSLRASLASGEIRTAPAGTFPADAR